MPLNATVGEHEYSKLSDDNKDFKLTLADSLLAKEKLDAALKYVFIFQIRRLSLVELTSTTYALAHLSDPRRTAAKIANREALTPRAEHQAGFVNQDPCKPAWELPM